MAYKSSILYVTLLIYTCLLPKQHRNLVKKTNKLIISTEKHPLYINLMKWRHVREHRHVNRTSNPTREEQHVMFTQSDKQIYNGGKPLSR